MCMNKFALRSTMCVDFWVYDVYRFVNYELSSQASRVKSSIGYAINEERSFYWRLTGRQNLEFFAVLSGLS